MEEYIFAAVIFYPGGLLVLFIINLFYFILKKNSEADMLFEFNEFDYKYEDVVSRLNLMQNYLNQNIDYAFKKAEHYYWTANRIKKKFIAYEERIELGMLLLYAKKSKDKPEKFLYDNLSPLFKIQVLYTLLFFPTLLVFSFLFVDDYNVILKFVFFILLTILVYTYAFVLTKLIIGIKYIFLELVFGLFKLNVGAIRRNMMSLDYLYSTSYFHRPLIVLITAAGFTSFVGRFNPKGFGGGDFGGGGAGGSW